MINRWYSDGVNNVGIKGCMPTACHSLLACKLYAVAMTTRAIKGRNPYPKFTSILPSPPKRHAGKSTPNNSESPYHTLTTAKSNRFHQKTTDRRSTL